jgi:hypothetical protein
MGGIGRAEHTGLVIAISDYSCVGDMDNVRKAGGTIPKNAKIAATPVSFDFITEPPDLIADRACTITFLEDAA